MSAIKPRTARVVIYQGDDLARLSEFDAAVTRAEAELRVAEQKAKRAAVSGPATLDEVSDEQDILEAARARHEEATVERDLFAEEAETRGVVVVMHAQPRKTWRGLMNEHGPREGSKEDEALGVNMDTLPDALLPLSIDREQSTIEGDVDVFLESLSDYDYYDRLFLQAFALNRGSAMADPTQRLASALSQTSAATSN
jgi:hypothetical protein